MDPRYESLDEMVVGKSGVEAFKMLPPELQAAAQLSKEFKHPDLLNLDLNKKLTHWKQGIRLSRGKVESAEALKPDDIYSTYLRKQRLSSPMAGLGQEAAEPAPAPMSTPQVAQSLLQNKLVWIIASVLVLLVLRKKKIIKLF